MSNTCSGCKGPRDGEQRTCSNCRKRHRERRHTKHAETGLCVGCGVRPAKPSKKHCQTCIDRNGKRALKYDRERRRDIISHYGGRCACCSEDNQYLLTIDHVHNDGADHRRLLGRNSRKIHQYIIANGYPDTFQLLCWNCNCSRAVYGSCPHTWKTGHPPEEVKRLGPAK